MEERTAETQLHIYLIVVTVRFSTHSQDLSAAIASLPPPHHLTRPSIHSGFQELFHKYKCNCSLNNVSTTRMFGSQDPEPHKSKQTIGSMRNKDLVLFSHYHTLSDLVSKLKAYALRRGNTLDDGQQMALRSYRREPVFQHHSPTSASFSLFEILDNYFLTFDDLFFGSYLDTFA